MEGFMDMLIGPVGGAVAIGFGAGCAATFGFMERVVYKARVDGMKREIDMLNEKVAVLEEKAKKYDDFMEGLAKGQLAKLESDE